jgi:hypothetical protein
MLRPARKILLVPVLALFAAAFSLISCGRACNAMYVYCGAAIRIQPAPALGTGTYVVHVESADAAYDVTCSSASAAQGFQCAPSDGTTVLVGLDPDSWLVQVRTQSPTMRLLVQRNGSTILDQPLALTYQTSEPWGAGCGICRNASAALSLN